MCVGSFIVWVCRVTKCVQVWPDYQIIRLSGAPRPPVPAQPQHGAVNRMLFVDYQVIPLSARPRPPPRRPRLASEVNIKSIWNGLVSSRVRMNMISPTPSAPGVLWRVRYPLGEQTCRLGGWLRWIGCAAVWEAGRAVCGERHLRWAQGVAQPSTRNYTECATPPSALAVPALGLEHP